MGYDWIFFIGECKGADDERVDWPTKTVVLPFMKNTMTPIPHCLQLASQIVEPDIRLMKIQQTSNISQVMKVGGAKTALEQANDNMKTFMMEGN